MESNFGEFLRLKRQQKGLTQRELAQMLFVSESAVSKWEGNAARPDISLLPRLSLILEVTEHELITASVDEGARTEKAQARKWRALSLFWDLFFYIGYGVALLTCFICNLAVNRTLSWFWIVLSALALAFSFTNLPKLLNKNRLVLLPLIEYLALAVLLGVCCIYTSGSWFWVAVISVLVGLVYIFAPIYIARLDIFKSVRKWNDFLSIAVDFIATNILLIVINWFTVSNGYAEGWWYFTIALPILAGVYAILNILLSVRLLRINGFFKTSIILFLINCFLYLPPMLIRLDNPTLQEELDQANILKADFSVWAVDKTLENNIHLIVALTLLALAVVFLLVGAIRERSGASELEK